MEAFHDTDSNIKMHAHNQKEGNKIALLNQDKIDQRFIYRFFKRIMDLILSSIALICLVPFFLVISTLIKVDDPKSPVFYSQNRIGRNGQKFKMYKFRSMFVGADFQLKDLLCENEVNGAMFKIRDDPRITKIGKKLRKYSIDELPQLLNVVKGDMALVGPRPPLLRELKEYTEFDKQRLMVTPGCTGLWQVTARNSVGFHEMVELDIEYIKKSSILFDIKIIFKTIWIMIKPNSAF